MKLNELLEQWSHKPDVPRLSLNPDGICVVKIKDSYYLSFEESPDGKGFYLYSVICKLNPEENNQWVLEVLSGNLFGKETGKNSLGYDVNTQALVLFKYLSNESTNYQVFRDHIEEFSAYQNYWEKKMNKLIDDSNAKGKRTMSQSLMESVSEKKVDIFFA